MLSNTKKARPSPSPVSRNLILKSAPHSDRVVASFKENQDEDNILHIPQKIRMKTYSRKKRQVAPLAAPAPPVSPIPAVPPAAPIAPPVVPLANNSPPAATTGAAAAAVNPPVINANVSSSNPVQTSSSIPLASTMISTLISTMAPLLSVSSSTQNGN